jgi:hypothetical protein
MAKKAAIAKKVTVELGEPQAKKHVVRFDAEAEDAAISNLYVTKVAMEKLGNPEAIKVTIEAA